MLQGLLAGVVGIVGFVVLLCGLVVLPFLLIDDHRKVHLLLDASRTCMVSCVPNKPEQTNDWISCHNELNRPYNHLLVL